MGIDPKLNQISQSSVQSFSGNTELETLAENQQKNVDNKKSIRDTESSFSSSVRDSAFSQSILAKTAGGLSSTGIASSATVSKAATYLGSFAMSGLKSSSVFSPAGLAKSLEVVGSSAKHYASGLKDFMDALKSKFEDASKDLESQDKLGNFEIQDLMSQLNQSETLASSVKKKTDDSNSSVIGKI